jgi:hypothetical protein
MDRKQIERIIHEGRDVYKVLPRGDVADLLVRTAQAALEQWERADRLAEIVELAESEKWSCIPDAIAKARKDGDLDG